MWLLHTQFLRLTYFEAPPPRYAILSHVWGKDETSFQELRPLPGTDVPVHVRRKVRDACKYASEEGFTYLWVDTCCIDKTNSTELSEAINSMFSWYAQATICYAYLDDVPGDQSMRNVPPTGLSFRKSKWHRRGWTLQELLAPAEVRFLDAKWECIGSKTFLAPLLEEITGINRRILTTAEDVFSISVAERMSWAPRRATTRPEDAAYSLMGIFNVNIPVIYGEGLGHAFRRLQEEIMRTSPDHTLFMWGSLIMSYSTICLCPSESGRSAESSLLAQGPSVFGGIGDEPQSHAFFSETVSYSRFMETLKQFFTDSDRRDIHTVPEFTVTAYGIRAHLPIIPLPTSLVGAKCPSTGTTDRGLGAHDTFLALLACSPQGAGTTSQSSLLTGLILRRPPGSHVLYVGASGSHHNRHQYGRYLLVTSSMFDMIRANEKIDWQSLWKTVYISQHQYNALSLVNSITQPSAPMPGIWVHIPGFVHTRLEDQGFKPPLAVVNERRFAGEPVGPCGLATVQCRLWPLRVKSYTFRRASTHGSSAKSSHSDGFRIVVGLCGEMLWAEAELLLGPTKNAANAEPDYLLHPETKDLPCRGVHITEWPSLVSPDEKWRLDEDGEFQWDYYRTFVLDGQRIHLRAAGVPVVHGRTDHTLVTLAVEVDVDSWAYPPPDMSNNTTQYPSIVRRLAGRLHKSKSGLGGT